MPRLRFRRPSPAIALLLAAWAVFCIWAAAGWLSARGIEEPAFEVLERRDRYEVRRYGQLLAAQVSITAPWAEALTQGTALLAAYVGGANTTQESIAMARPVGMEPEGEAIAGVTPVLAAARDTSWLISFVMPPERTDVTLPRPNDPRIRIVRIPARDVAVLEFSGSLSRDHVAEREKQLRSLLARDGAGILGPATVAQYHPSWAPSFIRRNEVMLPVRMPAR